uniref:Alpha/beta fold hydrolase n=1 Tax=Planktothricoides sp. SpSt-374 TaxID=2282167 RepID=A0A7C3ZIC0_9CYAN
MSPKYIYLHGFASGPAGAKARYLHQCFTTANLHLTIPDLNCGDFTHLTLTRQLQQVAALFPPPPQPVTLIGSSFGGLTAAWLAQKHFQINRIVLLAPAFEFLTHWLPTFSPSQREKWQNQGFFPIYHYAENREIPLHYQFVQDVAQYPEVELTRNIPTLIIHGINDEVIPIQASRNFAAHRPWVQLLETASDHSLGDVMPTIWQSVQDFCF